MSGPPDDRFEDQDLDRLLAQLPPPPPMREGLVDRIVGEAQRGGRTSAALPSWRSRASRRAWTRRGVWTGVIALNLIFASAVAAAFGGGVLSVAKIRAVAATIVEHIHHPHRHAIAAPLGASGARPSSAVRPQSRPPAVARVMAVPTPPIAPIAPHFQPATPLAGRSVEAHRLSAMPRATHAAAAYREHRGTERSSLREHHADLGRQSPFSGPGRLRDAEKNSREIPGMRGEPARADAGLGAGARADQPMAGEWQRPFGSNDRGVARGGQFGDGWRQRPWQRGAGFGARRFGYGGGFRPGLRRRFGPRGGGRPRGRPFRRRF